MRISDWSSDVCSSDLQAVERWEGRRHLVTEGVEGAVGHRLQPRIGQDVEAEAGKAVGRLVVEEARGDELAIGVDDGFEIQPRHQRADAVEQSFGRAANVGEEVQESQAIDILVAVEFGHAEDRKSTRLNSSN